MSRLILHAGGHKTGTTTLQATLLHNRDLLEQHGIGLAAGFHPIEGHHHSLVALLERQQFDQFLAAINTGHPTVIVSSEVLYRLLAHRHPALEALPSLIRSAFDQVTTVLMMRRQDHLKESLYAEVVMRWFTGDIREENHYLYDYRHAVGRLVELFGAEAFRLGVYRDDIAYWDAVAEFMQLADLGPVAPLITQIPRQRVSADRRVLQVLGQLEGPDRGLRADVCRLLQDSGALLPDPVKHLLSPAERRYHLERYSSSNRKLARAYRPDAEAYLTGELEQPPEHWEPPAPFSPGEIAQLLAAALGRR